MAPIAAGVGRRIAIDNDNTDNNSEMNGATSQSITVHAKRKQIDNNTSAVGQVTTTPTANQGKDTKEDDLKDKAELVIFQHTF